MMELEQPRRELQAATFAPGPQRGEGALLSLATSHHRRQVVVRRRSDVSHPVAIRAEKIALRRFGRQAIARHAPVADLEVLGPRAAVVKLERGRRAFVAASL